MVTQVREQTQNQVWSREHANTVEAALRELVSQMDSEYIVEGVSSKRFNDYKVFIRKNKSHKGQFMQYDPRLQRIVCWAGSAGQVCFDEVITFLQENFPYAGYSNGPGPSIDGFHKFIGITGEDLAM